ncbi:MAG: hypothetical protein JSR91_13795 [Proteobacteria bacterium]|nr:hypothetical protein [Pseudomonadota bacterium]
MSGRVVVVSHADADGHIIAEQTRRNLQRISRYKVRVVVDPKRTQNHRVWTRLNELPEIDKADTIFFMDLMFGHETFPQEAACLVDYARAHSDKRIFLVDHHPFPLRRLEAASNIRAFYRHDVADVALGPRDGMMIVAALCEHQHREVAAYRTKVYDDLALGVRRAAALGGNLPGDNLLALLRHDCWQALLDIAHEDRSKHPLPRGRRPSDAPASPAMTKATKTAQALIAGHLGSPPSMKADRRTKMVYDLTQLTEPFEPVGPIMPNRPASGKDKEALLTLLEVSALALTDTPEASFTLDDLIKQAQDLGGDTVVVDPKDAENIIEKAKFLLRVGGGRFRFQ